MEKDTLIKELLSELSYRSNEGYPILNNREQISIIAEILDEWNLTEIKNELIKNLLEADGETFTATNKDTGETSVFQSKDNRDAAIKKGTHTKTADSEEEEPKGDKPNMFSKESGYDAPDLEKDTDGDEGVSDDEIEKQSDSVDSDGISDASEPTVVTSSDEVGSTIKTPSGTTLYSLGGGYYADSPAGTPKYIRTESVELININSMLSEIKAQNQKGETITVQPISDKDLDKAIQKSKIIEFPKFSEKSDDDIVDYLIGTKTKPAKFKLTKTNDALSELDESREDAYAGKNSGKGGPSTTAQEEVSCRIIELSLEYPESKGNEIIELIVDEMEKMPFYSKKSRKQLTSLAVKSSAGMKIAKFVADNDDFNYNPTQPNGFPKSFAFSGKATNTISNFLVTKLKEAKESGDSNAITHYENELRKFAQHSTSATGNEGDGDTALMYEDNNGRVRIVHITNKQAYNDPKLNATKKSRVLDIKENAVEGTDIEKLTLINDIASGDVIGMNASATTSMQSLKNDLTLKDDVENIPTNIINAVYGNKTFEPSEKYKKNALKNKLVIAELKKMGKDPETVTDSELIQAIVNTVGESGSTQISDSTTGSPGKLLMKMGNLCKDVNTKFDNLRKKYSKKSDDEICEMISKIKEPKSGNPLYGGKLSSDEICQIRNNNALKKLSEISDARGESMRTTHNKIVDETKEADVKYFMDKQNVSEAEARKLIETQNGPHTETVVRTFMKGMHWTRSIMGDADTEMLQSVGSRHVKSEDYRECLASLTGFSGDTSTREGRESLVNHLAKNVRITPGDGSVQFINNKTGKAVLLGEDTWRTAGDGEKIAGHDGKDLIQCLQSKPV
tara:strand:- start:118 stop:2664 length:2547 start_codon:yes stop_codon:yes gene_type:complete